MSDSLRDCSDASDGTPPLGFRDFYLSTATQLAIWARLRVPPVLRASVPIEDFLQETWARAYQAYPQFDPAEGRFDSWLFGIARNVLREQLRRMSVRHRYTSAPSGERVTVRDVIDPATSAASRANSIEISAALQEAIDLLSETERQIVLLRGIEGLPFATISERLGISEVAADSRWRRALSRLRFLLPEGLLVQFSGAESPGARFHR